MAAVLAGDQTEALRIVVVDGVHRGLAVRELNLDVVAAAQQMATATSELGSLQRESVRLNLQLADSNRGLVALHSELDDKNDSLQRNENIKSRVVASVSHEFCTPINSILGITQLLLDASMAISRVNRRSSSASCAPPAKR